MISRRGVIQTSVVVAAAVLALVGAIAWRLSAVASGATPASLSFYDLTAHARDGRVAPLAAYRGQVALVVNVAVRAPRQPDVARRSPSSSMQSSRRSAR